MGLRVNTNIPAINAQRQTNATSKNLLNGFQKLASGLRINRAADDAAGLAIAERFQSRFRQYGAEVNNLQTGVNVAQTADGALSAQTEALQRARELAVQAANGTLTPEQRGALNEEVQQILGQIEATANETEFNGTVLLNGTTTTVPIGTESQNIEITLPQSTVAALGLAGTNTNTQANAGNAITRIDTALQRIGESRATLGAQQAGFESAIEQREIAAVNTAASEAQIRDLDMARQVIEQTRNGILLQGGIAAISQANVTGANAARLLGG